MGKFECQANAAETGERSSASPLQSSVSADTFRQLADDWAWEIVNEFVGEDHLFEAYPGAAQRLAEAIARLVVEKAANAQRQTEEPSGDEALLSNSGQPDTNSLSRGEKPE